MAKVLVIRFSALGDLTMVLPTIDYLLSNGDQVHLLTKEAYTPLIKEYSPHVVVHTISNHATFKELSGAVRSLRQYHFDQVFDLHRNIRSFFTTLMLRRPYKRISKYRFKEFFLFFLKRRLFLSFFSPIDRAGEALSLVGAKEYSYRPLIKPTHSELPVELGQWLQKEKTPYICVAVESAWIQKEWGVDRFVDVARRVQALGYGIVWLGLRPLPEQAKLARSLDLTSRLELSDVVRVLRGAALLVCNDSGLMHIAESVGIPVAAIFGPTSRELGFAPRSPKSKIVESSLWCRPCSKTGRLCIRPISRWKCLSEVTVDAVFDTVKQMVTKGV